LRVLLFGHRKNGSGTQIAFHHLSMSGGIWHRQKGIPACPAHLSRRRERMMDLGVV
jgi:hypothetical protein